MSLETSLDFDNPVDRAYEIGIDRLVMFTPQPYVWNGAISMTIASDGHEKKDHYIDGEIYRRSFTREFHHFTLSTYYYPPIVENIIGYDDLGGLLIGDRPHKRVDLAYRTKLYNRLGEFLGYRIYLMYACTIDVDTMVNKTESREMAQDAIQFNIYPDIVSLGVRTGVEYLILDQTRMAPDTFNTLHDKIYGNGQEATMPTIIEIAQLFDDTLTYDYTRNNAAGFVDIVTKTAGHSISGNKSYGYWNLVDPTTARLGYRRM